MKWYQALWQKLLPSHSASQNSAPSRPELTTPFGISSIILEKKYNADQKSGLYNLDAPPDLAQEPAIIVLPGNGTINTMTAERNQFMSGTVKYAQAPGYRIYGIAYSARQETDRTKDEYNSHDKTRKSPPEKDHAHGWSPDAQDILEKIIQPNIPVLHDLSSEDRAEALIDCFHRFRNLKIFGNCYGGIVSANLNNGLNSLMRIHGFSPEECGTLIPQIMYMGVAGITNTRTELEKNIPAMTSFDLKALNDDRLMNMYDAFSDIEYHIQDKATAPTDRATMQYDHNNIVFYAFHHPEKLGQDSSLHGRMSHSINTYLDTRSDMPALADPFAVVHQTIWYAMTNHQSTRALREQITDAGQNNLERWQFVQERFGHPLNEIFLAANHNPAFHDLMGQAKHYSTRNFPQLSTQATTAPPVFAADINYPINYNALKNALSSRADPQIVDFLLKTPFSPRGDGYYQAGVPSWLSSPENTEKINDVSRTLFRTTISELYAKQENYGHHDTTILHYRDVDYLRYFAVDAQTYETRVKPLQERWQQNNTGQDLMSLLHDMEQEKITSPRKFDINLPQYRARKFPFPEIPAQPAAKSR